MLREITQYFSSRNVKNYDTKHMIHFSNICDERTGGQIRYYDEQNNNDVVFGLLCAHCLGQTWSNKCRAQQHKIVKLMMKYARRGFKPVTQRSVIITRKEKTSFNGQQTAHWARSGRSSAPLYIPKGTVKVKRIAIQIIF